MANALYDKGREAFLGGTISWSGDTIKAVLVATSLYTVDLATHQFLSDVAGGARIATSGALTTKTVTAGVADADDAAFTAVAGVAVAALVLYKDTGSAASSPLIAYLDTVTGLPFTPSGGDVTIVWANTANRIFKL